MEAIKNCYTCSWGARGTLYDFASPLSRCSQCSTESSVGNPYPLWTSKEEAFFKVMKPPTAATEDVAKTTIRFNDIVNHPKHYTVHPSGVECIQITEHMNFCLGNAMKYIWRAGEKHETPLEDLKKARWYIEREITRLENL